MPNKCDCLNYCGDDPWLNDGRAEPCKSRKSREDRKADIENNWKLVPIAPDKRMIGAAEQIIRECYDMDRVQASLCAAAVWDAMLKYAPQPEH